ncbi:MAG TPA: phosphopyruvate hydratase [Acidimicrobiales bacterium]|nr:phosphopyruvate hydratase [Acidimicrobiales bacterium]
MTGGRKGVTEVAEVFAWEALDSRGRPTVGCRARLAGGAEGRAVVPSGASTGSHEAVELRDGGGRFGGWGARQAVSNLNQVLAPAVVGMDALDRAGIDALMEDLDGSAGLGRLGANAVLALSLAVTVAGAEGLRRPLWQVLDGGAQPLLPLPMVNVVSGGAHAGGALDVQDVLVVPVGAHSFAEAIEWAWRARTASAELLAARGGLVALVADEGGLGAGLASNEAALALVTDGIARAGLTPGEQVALAIDVAANQVYDGQSYQLRVEGRSFSSAEWLAELARWCGQYPIVSLEDVLAEDDWEGWQQTRGLVDGRRQLVGDDLFATQADRLRRGVAKGVANAVLVKPNQAGTVTRAEAVLRAAQRAGYATVVSARSGDTEDSWLADLAVGWRAGQIKVGSTTRSERTAKWNRLLEIEATAGGQARFAGREALATELLAAQP